MSSSSPSLFLMVFKGLHLFENVLFNKTTGILLSGPVQFGFLERRGRFSWKKPWMVDIVKEFYISRFLTVTLHLRLGRPQCLFWNVTGVLGVEDDRCENTQREGKPHPPLTLNENWLSYTFSTIRQCTVICSETSIVLGRVVGVTTETSSFNST